MSDEIERVPSLRKPSRQGVPKRKPRDMAKPMLESGKTKDAPQIAPRGMPGGPTPHVEPRLPEEPVLPVDPTLALELELAGQPVLEGMAPPVSEAAFAPAPELEPEPAAEPEPEVEPEPAVDPEPEPQPEPVFELMPPPTPEPRPESTAHPESTADPLPQVPPRLTLRQLLARADVAFEEFRAAAYRYPKEHMDERLGEDLWTRKQMLAHVAAWHDLAAERLIKMSLTGHAVPLDRAVDKVNAAAARVAIGKTAGEVLKDVEATYARLRRQLQRMTDEQLHLDDDWALQVIAGDTYEHYQEHIAELTPPEPPPGSGARR